MNHVGVMEATMTLMREVPGVAVRSQTTLGERARGGEEVGRVRINNSPKKVGRERTESNSLVAQGGLKAAGKEPEQVTLNW